MRFGRVYPWLPHFGLMRFPPFHVSKSLLVHANTQIFTNASFQKLTATPFWIYVTSTKGKGLHTTSWPPSFVPFRLLPPAPPRFVPFRLLGRTTTSSMYVFTTLPWFVLVCCIASMGNGDKLDEAQRP
ncbi:hypothetical protein SLA2020_280830 [Shorea laevis]